MERSITVTVLVENTASGRGPRGEHGLALWIESGSRRVLFDTGQSSEVLLHNAEQLGIDLTVVDAVVLSHGHYDHSGGLRTVLERSGGSHLYLHPSALVRRFSRKEGGAVQEIGTPADLDEAFLRSHPGAVTGTSTATSISGFLKVSGTIPRATDFEDTGGDFYLDEACTEPDPIVDDQAVFFDTRDGTVVLLGCGHAGVVNTLTYVQELTGARPVHAVIGGMHLVNASPTRLSRTLETFRQLDIRLLAPAHCTGARAQALLGTELPDRWRPCPVGTSFEFLAVDAGTHVAP
jgi:7,8-dihydropterin-6-yl-methyl-4-(beta-D-ribofuranosyl)aminobenzene 5'-phosphate synthase